MEYTKLTEKGRKKLYRSIYSNMTKYGDVRNVFEYEFEEDDVSFADGNNDDRRIKIESMNSLAPNNSDRDYDAAILLFEAFPNIELRQASDQCFWVYLSHVDLFKYVATRYPVTANTTPNVILDHWFARRYGSLFRHSLAGLWWAVHQTIDETNNDDKYHLTRVLFRSSELRTRTLMTYQMSRNKEVVKAVLKFIRDNDGLFQNNAGDKYDKITKHLSILGGSRPLIVFDEDMIKQELENIFPINQNNGTV